MPYFGWLGQTAERHAWDDARRQEECDFFAGLNTHYWGRPLYREYNEVAWELTPRYQLFKNRPFTWDLERKLWQTGRLPFELIPTHDQDTGDCVAAGLAGAGMKLQVIEIALGGEEELFREWFVPWIYAISRNQIGGGMSRDGSTGVWGARAVNEYGVLFSDDLGVPGYAGTSDLWGHRRNIRSPVYNKFMPLAYNNPVEIIRIKTVDEMVELMDAGMQLTIASSQGFRLTTYKGLHVYRPSGSWSHQMHLTDIRRDPELMFYRMNQWGAEHAKPLNNETPGGAWNFASDLEREIGRAEVYGYSLFAGEPGEPDYHIV